jgi:hypothetical protein
MKKLDISKYVIIWVEGIGYRTGEKVKALTDTGFEYTTLLTEALRVKREDLPQIRAYMKRHGIADFVIEGANTFISTTYAPKGTILNTKRIAI